MFSKHLIYHVFVVSSLININKSIFLSQVLAVLEEEEDINEVQMKGKILTI